MVPGLKIYGGETKYLRHNFVTSSVNTRDMCKMEVLSFR